MMDDSHFENVLAGTLFLMIVVCGVFQLMMVRAASRMPVISAAEMADARREEFFATNQIDPAYAGDLARLHGVTAEGPR